MAKIIPQALKAAASSRVWKLVSNSRSTKHPG
jgi:hypothetical protein